MKTTRKATRRVNGTLTSWITGWLLLLAPAAPAVANDHAPGANDVCDAWARDGVGARARGRALAPERQPLATGLLWLIGALALGAASPLWAAAKRSDPGEGFTVAGIAEDAEALGGAHDVQILDAFLYVPGKSGSLAIVEISDPTRPALKGSLALDEDAQTVLCTPEHAFVGGRDFHSVHIGDPANAQVAAVLRDRPRIDRINGMVRWGEHLLYANKTGWVGMIDVRDPADPKLVGAIDSRKHGGLISPHDIAVYRNHIVVVDQRDESPLKVRLYRVADEETGRLLPPERWQLAGAVGGERLNGANRVDIHGDYALVGCNKARTLAVIDLADPQRPQAVEILDFPGELSGLVVSGAVAFAAGGQTVQAYDLTDPRKPVLLASFTSERAFPSAFDRDEHGHKRMTTFAGEAAPMRGNAHDLVYRGGYVYVTAQSDHQVAILKVEDATIRERAEQPRRRPGAEPVRAEEAARRHRGKTPPARFGGLCRPVEPKEPVTMQRRRRVRPQYVLFDEEGRVDKLMYSTEGSGKVSIASALAETEDGGRSWTDHPANPVLDRIESPWQGRRAFVTAVARDPDHDRWVMATVGDDTSDQTPGLRAVGLWFSDDLVEWTQHEANPVITVETDNAMGNTDLLPGPHDPPVGMYLRDFQKIGGTWHALVQWRGGGAQSSWSRMTVMRSTGGIAGPWRFRNLCFDPAGASAWAGTNRKLNWSQPVQVDGRWYAVCQNGVEREDRDNTRLGLVVSDDYFHWRELDNPVTAPLVRPDGSAVVSSQQFLLPPEGDLPWRILLGARGVHGQDKFMYLVEP